MDIRGVRLRGRRRLLKLTAILPFLSKRLQRLRRHAHRNLRFLSAGKIPRLFHREAVEEMEIQISFAEGVKQGESIRKMNRGRGSRPRLLLSSSGRFQGSQERLSFKGFLQGFFSAEHSRCIKKPSFEGS